MHVAKAAGSTINDVIARQFCTNDVALHFETVPPADNDSLRSKKFISGHPFYYAAKKRLPFIDRAFKITVFRKPSNQLMSHIAWVRRMAEPKYSLHFHHHAEHFQKMAIRLKNMDLSCPKELAEFANNLNPFEQITFDNFQTRYLIPKSPRQISRDDFKNVKTALREFDIIGTTESLETFLVTLFREMDWVYPEDICDRNIAGDYFGLDPDDPAQQRALHPLLTYDWRLYATISEYCV